MTTGRSRRRPPGTVLAMTEAVRPVGDADRVLVARLVAGDAAALAEAYDALASVVFGVAVRVLGDRTAAEDVSQEVFVQLWRDASAIDLDRCSLRGWVS